jgi:ribosomal protein L12E/L44/L45/RPP1/RPP2
MATLKKILEAARLIERTEADVSVTAPAGDDDIDAIIRRAAQADAAISTAPPPLPGTAAAAAAVACTAYGRPRRRPPHRHRTTPMLRRHPRSPASRKA